MKFSIIICTYNSERYLSSCLGSLKNQSFRDFEVIIVDGYSSDQTVNIITKFSKSIPLLVYKQKPSGISAAMNYGIRKSKGDYLIHLHSDDLLYDNQTLLNINNFIIGNESLDWFYGKINIIEENGVSLAVFPDRKIFQLNISFILKYINYIPHQAVFIRKRVFDRYGYFDENITSSMDYDLWLRICDKTNWKFYDGIISKFRIHQESQSSGKKNKYINQSNQEKVQKRYVNNYQLYLVKIINRILWQINSNLR